MKTNYLLLKSFALGIFFTTASWSQTTLVSWNFNGPSAATVPGGALNPTPAFGAGTAELVGGTTATFASGNSSVGTMETETENPPNYGWNTTGYPASGIGNMTAGVQYETSTVGFMGIVFRMEQRLSNTAANTYVVQYTADVSATVPVWVDAQMFTFDTTPDTGDLWWNFRTVDVSDITALDNNPNVAFRVVSAFDPEAGNYLPARSSTNYAGGTVRFDSVAITAESLLSTPQFELENSFTMSPNPSRNQVVNFNVAQDISVYDTVGKLILTAKDASSIDTGSFRTGVYFVKTGTGITKKLVVE